MKPIGLHDNHTSPLFFTAPWEPVSVRRGDALGLVALADQRGRPAKLAGGAPPGLSSLSLRVADRDTQMSWVRQIALDISSCEWPSNRVPAAAFVAITG